MEQEIIDGQLIQTTAINLEDYIASKKREIEEIQINISYFTTQLNNTLNELNSLIVTE